MVKANVEDPANNLVEELSGVKGKEYGQLQPNPRYKYPLLDVPTTYLDISYQIELLDLLTDLNQNIRQPFA